MPRLDPLVPDHPVVALEGPSRQVGFLVAPLDRGRWGLFDLSGETRIKGAAVAGAVVLRDGDVISGPGFRYRFVARDGSAVVAAPGVRCSLCRATLDAQSSRVCPTCGGLAHAECLARRCGRCLAGVA